MIYGYIRVSTDKQDRENQKLGIESKASALGLCIDKYIEDAGISGTKEPEQRALGGVLRHLNPGDVICCRFCFFSFLSTKRNIIDFLLIVFYNVFNRSIKWQTQIF